MDKLNKLTNKKIKNLLEKIAEINYKIIKEEFQGDSGLAFENNAIISIYEEGNDYAGFHDLTSDETLRNKVDPIKYYGKENCLKMIKDYYKKESGI